MPSMPGIMTSTMTASNDVERACSSPSSPLEATVTRYPSRVNSASRISRITSSSSTTRTEPVRAICPTLLSVPRRERRPRPGERERQHEPCALPHLALAVDRSLVLPYDAVGNRQAKAGTLVHRLGREERVVDPREVFIGDPR